MTEETTLNSYVTECQSRLSSKRRLAGLCLFILVLSWTIELGFFATTVSHGALSILLTVLSITALFASAVHIARRFGQAGDPGTTVTCAYLDRKLESGSLIESTWESQKKNTVPRTLLQHLQTQCQQVFIGHSPESIIPIRSPRGFELGLALSAVIALLLFAGPFNDKNSTVGSMAVSSSLLDNDVMSTETVSGSSKTENEAGKMALLKFQNTKPGVTAIDRKNSQSKSDPQYSVFKAKPTTQRNPSTNKTDSKSLASNPDKKKTVTQKDPIKSADTGSKKSPKTDSDSIKKTLNTGKDGAQSNSKSSTELAKDFKGQGSGAVRKSEKTGTVTDTFVLNSKSQNSLLNGVKVDLSWPLKHTLQKYFRKLAEEKQ